VLGALGNWCVRRELEPPYKLSSTCQVNAAGATRPYGRVRLFRVRSTDAPSKSSFTKLKAIGVITCLSMASAICLSLKFTRQCLALARRVGGVWAKPTLRHPDLTLHGNVLDPGAGLCPYLASPSAVGVNLGRKPSCHQGHLRYRDHMEGDNRPDVALSGAGLRHG